ncbi:MAG TPA: pyruvate formate-lyase-activating protein [Syntrophomonadaceae bacterium]|mgnify:CR=1 FL=1|nr:pyruvate formate-lyase-activating protein [Syntrophomonadaceae bacterium]HQA06962.1 pyruvate formate-lyase-activating protein [Syntrophomonadaceae bacterium]HQE23914.1 pyruvate formate-lyase-activating protein [Syntrophomonadaceae bacterium]
MGLVHSIDTFSTLDGPGIRTVIFLQGCPLRCRYCQNPDTWSMANASAQEYTAAELIKIIRRGIPYFRASGGGVTVSGGEPLLQAEFVEELFTACQAEHISTAIDTSLYVSTSKVERVLPVTDLFLADIKHIDSQKSHQLTGLGNQLNIANLCLINQHNVRLWIRYVVVPDLTDNPQDVTAMAELVKTLDRVERIDLLPYHALGAHKWDLLGLDYTLHRTQPPSSQQMNDLAQLIRSITGKPVYWQ